MALQNLLQLTEPGIYRVSLDSKSYLARVIGKAPGLQITHLYHIASFYETGKLILAKNELKVIQQDPNKGLYENLLIPEILHNEIQEKRRTKQPVENMAKWREMAKYSNYGEMVTYLNVKEGLGLHRAVAIAKELGIS